MVRVGLLGCMVGILGCSPDYGVEIDGEGLTAEPVEGTQEDDQGNEEEDPNDEVDPEIAEAFEDAIIRIVYPPSGEFLPYGETHTFEAVSRTRRRGAGLRRDRMDRRRRGVASRRRLRYGHHRRGHPQHHGRSHSADGNRVATP